MKFNKKLGLICASAVIMLSLGSGAINSLNTTTVHADDVSRYLNHASLTSEKQKEKAFMICAVKTVRKHPETAEGFISNMQGNPYFNETKFKQLADKSAREHPDSYRKYSHEDSLDKFATQGNSAQELEDDIDDRSSILSELKKDPEDYHHMKINNMKYYRAYKGAFKHAKAINDKMTPFQVAASEVDVSPADNYKVAIAKAEKKNRETHGAYKRELLKGWYPPLSKSAKHHRRNRKSNHRSKQSNRTKLIKARRKIRRKSKRAHSKRILRSLKRQFRKVNNKLK